MLDAGLAHVLTEKVILKDWPDDTTEHLFANADTARVFVTPDGMEYLVFDQICTGEPVRRVYRLDRWKACGMVKPVSGPQQPAGSFELHSLI